MENFEHAICVTVNLIAFGFLTVGVGLALILDWFFVLSWEMRT